MSVKYIATTSQTQGLRKSDFCNESTEEGDPVVFVFECDTDKENIDGSCGCRRSMKGVNTGGSTTTFIVMESDNPNFYKELHAKIKSSLQMDWLMTPKEADKQAKMDVFNLKQVSIFAEVGTIVEKRGDTFKVRKEKV